ncbi:LOW QUALITY PROTEIN: hypothetical protein HID58_074653, partial [Brassica napus]
TITEEPPASIFLDAGETSGRRHRALCSVQCSSPSSACSSSCSALLRLRSFQFSVLTTRLVFWGSSHFAIMPVSFNHLRISRSMSRRHGLPSALPSLPHQVVSDTLSPCVAGTPPCCRVSVPIAHFLLKTSSSRTNLTRSSSTNTCFNGPLLWDSEETRRTALPLRLAEELVYSGGPTSPRSEMHRLPFGGGRSISGVCLLSLLSYPLKRLSRVGPRVSFSWAWTTKSTIFASPQTSHPNLKPTRSVRSQKMQPPRLLCVVSKGWPSTSHYVTKFQLPDFVGNALSTHPSFVLNSQLYSFEDLSFLIWFVIVVYAFDLRGWIIPSYVCTEES